MAVVATQGEEFLWHRLIVVLVEVFVIEFGRESSPQATIVTLEWPERWNVMWADWEFSVDVYFGLKFSERS